MNRLQLRCFATALLMTSLPAMAAGSLHVSNGWIRSAPPSAAMLAGYATLHNSGDAAVTISAVAAAGFADSSLHESILVGDISRMQALGTLTVAAGATVEFAPGGKHIMLMGPTKVPTAGESVAIRFTLADGSSQTSDFIVRDDAAAKPDPHAGHDHQH